MHTVNRVGAIIDDYMDLQKAVGQSIFKFRHQKGLSQMKLAELADLHLNTIQSLESGKYRARVLTLFQIARALNIKVRDLVADIEAKKPKLSDFD